VYVLWKHVPCGGSSMWEGTLTELSAQSQQWVGLIWWWCWPCTCKVNSWNRKSLLFVNCRNCFVLRHMDEAWRWRWIHIWTCLWRSVCLAVCLSVCLSVSSTAQSSVLLSSKHLNKHSQTISSFRRHLKTHYFQSAYAAPWRPSPMRPDSLLRLWRYHLLTSLLT